MARTNYKFLYFITPKTDPLVWECRNKDLETRLHAYKENTEENVLTATLSLCLYSVALTCLCYMFPSNKHALSARLLPEGRLIIQKPLEPRFWPKCFHHKHADHMFHLTLTQSKLQLKAGAGKFRILYPRRATFPKTLKENSGHNSIWQKSFTTGLKSWLLTQGGWKGWGDCLSS